MTCPRTAAVAAMFRHAWRGLVSSPATYVFQAAFLIALTAGVFPVGGLIDSDYASLDVLWAALPWVALVIVPALAMRAFSPGGDDRALELTMSMPFTDLEIVLGTWLAGTMLLLVSLAFTAPVAMTLGWLGAPDWGAVTAGYAGAALLLAAYYAVALFASARTRDPVSAYLLALGLLLAATLAGSDTAARLVHAPAAVMDVLGLLSPKLMLDTLATGRMPLATVLDCLLLTGLALWGAAAAIGSRREGAAPAGAVLADAVTGGLALTAVLAVMAVLSTLDHFADLTEDRRHTLDPATIEAARALPAGTTADLYWSESETAVPARIRAHAHRAARLLQAIARASAGRLAFTSHDTPPDSEEEWEARGRGVQKIALSSGDHFQLGLVLRQGDRQRTLDYLDIDRAGLLEYDLALASSRLAPGRPPRVGVISPLLTPSNVAAPREGLSVIDMLERSADVAIIPFFAESLPDGLDVVVVIGANLMKPAMVAALEAHVAHGKGLIVCLDPLTRFNPASDQAVPVATGGGDTIADLLARRGLSFEAAVTGDAALAAPVSGADQTKTAYPFWLRVPRAQIAADNPVTVGLRELLFAEAGAFSVAAGSAAVPLVTTTATSGGLPAGLFKNAPTGALAAKLSPDGRVRTLAAFVPPAIYAVADVDWLFDPLAVQNAGSSAARPLNDNHAFLANMIDAAGGDRRLLHIRTRGNADRRFTRIDAMARAARERLGGEEEAARAKIAKVEATFAEILKAAGVQRVVDLPPEIRGKIEALDAALLPVRRKLGVIRREMREEVENLGRGLTLANLAAGPGLTLAFATLVSARRRRFQTRAGS